MSDPFCFSWQRLSVIVLLFPLCVHLSQSAETWSPLSQDLIVLLLI